MPRPGGSAAVSVERFFQFSLLGLVASGYLAVVGSGYLDGPTATLVAAGLLLRGLLICGIIRLEISEKLTTLITLAYAGFYAIDYFLLSREFLAATVHLVFFLAVLKILTAQTGRDYLYTAVIAFLELVAAAILSINFNFFLFLALYLLFAMAALTSGEIRRSMHHATPSSTARGGLRRFHSRLAVLSVSVTGGILILTAGLFFILPRTADAALSRLIPHRIFLPGFSNHVTLGEIGEIKTNSRAVMHIQLFSRDRLRGLKWRGGALTEFDGKHWTNPPQSQQVLLLENGYVNLGTPPSGGRRISYEVQLEALETDTLFFAGTPQRIDLHATRLLRSDTGTIRLPRAVPSTIVKYGAFSVLEERPEDSPTLLPAPVLPLPARERYLQKPLLDPRIPELARIMAAGAGSDLDRARAIERALRTEYGYTLELPDHEVPDPLAYFLFSRRKGHCEYFASSMALLLRSVGIPARLATGFQSGVYNPLTDLWLIRASDAHTWVEAWIPGHGWTTFDPTPPDPGNSQFNLASKLGLYLDAAETFWQEWVVSYDMGRQGTLMDRMEQGARRVGIRWFDSLSGVQFGWFGSASAWTRKHAWKVVVVLVVAFWSWLLGPPLLRLFRMRRRVQLVRRGQASAGDATLLYGRMLHILKRRGYQKPAWFTPMEFATSLPSGPLGGVVAEFTSAYNAVRFGGRTDVAQRMSVLLDELERQPVN